MSGLEHVALIASSSELVEQSPQGRIEPASDLERRVAAEQRFQRHPQGARPGQRQDVARRHVSAVAVRAAATEQSLLDNRDRPTCPPKEMRTSGPDTPAATTDTRFRGPPLDTGPENTTPEPQS